LVDSKTDRIWVIGNGESRKTFPLNSIHDYTIGCNAVHRDRAVDRLVAVDKRMVKEVLAHDSCCDKPIHTRPEWLGEFMQYHNVCAIPNLPFTGPNRQDQQLHWNSGPLAVLLAAEMSKGDVFLLGFDLYSQTGKLNNLYKNTPNYGTSTDRAVPPNFWVYQLARVFNFFSHINFFQVQPTGWTPPKEWKTIPNLEIKYF